MMYLKLCETICLHARWLIFEGHQRWIVIKTCDAVARARYVDVSLFSEEHTNSIGKSSSRVVVDGN